ncbi:uncharacterized protein LOC114793627 [Denticeps clupeoides]|uniref:uncharacterized protein LOC114793627 n=1 Tax=Denticeps clupeoides TaxID=299321 RepID=UPI0010A2D344|nr:uncharacterized protein LOC114793627 [Denticeps clupeoides]
MDIPPTASADTPAPSVQKQEEQMEGPQLKLHTTGEKNSYSISADPGTDQEEHILLTENVSQSSSTEKNLQAPSKEYMDHDTRQAEPIENPDAPPPVLIQDGQESRPVMVEQQEERVVKTGGLTEEAEIPLATGGTDNQPPDVEQDEALSHLEVRVHVSTATVISEETTNVLQTLQATWQEKSESAEVEAKEEKQAGVDGSNKMEKKISTEEEEMFRHDENHETFTQNFQTFIKAAAEIDLGNLEEGGIATPLLEPKKDKKSESPDGPLPACKSSLAFQAELHPKSERVGLKVGENEETGTEELLLLKKTEDPNIVNISTGDPADLSEPITLITPREENMIQGHEGADVEIPAHSGRHTQVEEPRVSSESRNTKCNASRCCSVM